MSKHHDVGFSVAIGRTPTPTRQSPWRAAAAQPTTPPAVLAEVPLEVVTFAGYPEVHVRLGDPGIRHRVVLDSIDDSGGPWARLMMSATITACDETIADKYFAQIDEGYEGELCKKGCFTPVELRRAAAARDAETKRLAEETARFQAEREEHSRQLETSREQRRDVLRRFKTGETPPIIKAEPEPDPDSDG